MVVMEIPNSQNLDDPILRIDETRENLDEGMDGGRIGSWGWREDGVVTFAHRGLVLALVFIKKRGLSPASLSSIGVEELSLEALHLLDELLEGEDGVHKQGG